MDCGFGQNVKGGCGACKASDADYVEHRAHSSHGEFSVLSEQNGLGLHYPGKRALFQIVLFFIIHNEA